jgi:hypothetical protein
VQQLIADGRLAAMNYALGAECQVFFAVVALFPL